MEERDGSGGSARAAHPARAPRKRLHAPLSAALAGPLPPSPPVPAMGGYALAGLSGMPGALAFRLRRRG